jgi:tetratricopeptide (TPR) repeat protein
MGKRWKRRKQAAPPAPAPASAGANGAPIDWTVLARALAIAGVVLWIYWPSLPGAFLWDDDSYITENRLLHSVAGLGTIWFQPGAFRDWYPIEETALWIEWQLWGLHTLGYHVVNVVLHIVSAWLVWRLLAQFGLRLAWMGGLLFAIHPVQVESVAWISELKNTLAQPFILLAMISYVDFDQRKDARAYGFALGCFLVAVLCKLSVVLFPFVILLHAWWKRGRLDGNDLKAATPFFAVALLAGSVTTLGGVWGKEFAHLPPHFLPPDGIWGRLALAGEALAFYFSKAFLPVGLLPVYPLWPVQPFSFVSILPWAGLGAVIGWCWHQRRGWGRHALLGLGFFVINLAPCPGFLPAPNMGYAWVMDHFLYLPLLGLIGLVIAGWERLGDRLSLAMRRIAGTFAAIVLAALAIESHSYARLYRDSETLWTYTLAHNPRAWPGHNNLGRLRQAAGHLDAAIAEYEQALQIEPAYPEAHYNLGLALQQSGRLPEAMDQYRQALQFKADYAQAHNDLGNALLLAGRLPEAMAEYQQALEINPAFAEAHNDLGSAWQRQNQLAEALAQYEQAETLDPEDAQAHYNRALILQQTGRLPEAIAEYREAVQLAPDNVPARAKLESALRSAGEAPGQAGGSDQAGDALNHYNLGTALAQQGRYPEAIAQFQESVRLAPDSIQVRNNLAVVLARTGRIPEAIAQLQAAQQIDPANAEISRNLAKLQALQSGASANP